MTFKFSVKLLAVRTTPHIISVEIRLYNLSNAIFIYKKILCKSFEKAHSYIIWQDTESNYILNPHERCNDLSTILERARLSEIDMSACGLPASG